jgi:hypothetical protein
VSISLQDLDRARRDPAVFAELLVGRPLWPHQLEVVASPARYRVICAGRRSGKSIVFGVLALHHAFAVPGSKVLIVSAGDVASKRLFKEVVGMASAPLLGASVADETTSLLTLSNGSTVECVPSSMRQVRSAEADLLLVDEAGFVAQEIWEAAEPVILARPGSRVLLASSPWGGSEHFFRVLWQQGMTAPDGQVAAWHWPSSVSPMVDTVLLEQIRERSRPDYFAREYLAEWTDESGSYFTSAELDAAATLEAMVYPADGGSLGTVVGGVDWGFARDANALSVIAARVELDGRGRQRFWVPFVLERFALAYDDWIDELAALSGVGEEAGFRFGRLVCEANGVGAMPSQVLGKRFAEGGQAGVVETVWTTAALKENAFGYLRILLQQGRIELPREPALLKQLRSLEFEQTPLGGLRIAVPERAGHDDLAMSLCLALSAVMVNDLEPVEPERIVGMADVLGEEWDEEGLSWQISPY